MTRLFQNHFHENRFQRLWWAQDGAPCHGLLAVCARLNRLFGERVLSLHTSNGWPPRSPNLTHCDFFIWGYLKDKIFRIPPRFLNVPRQKIITESNLLRENRDFITRSVQHMRSRADTCVHKGEGYVEGNL